VRIKGLGWDKINHAFSEGGAALTQQTAGDFLGIPIDYYFKVDLQSFVRIVDEIGGISIDVEKRMQYEDTWDHFVIDLKPGLQKLDGSAAIQYVRYRDEEGDIGRVKRQQKFIRAVLSEVTTPMTIMKAPGIVRETFALFDTNIPARLMFAIVQQLKYGLNAGFRTDMVKGLPYYINDISYWVPDVMETRRQVAAMQGVPFSGNIQAMAQRISDEYRRNLPPNAYLDDGAYSVEMDKPQVKPVKVPVPAPKKVTVPPLKAPLVTTPPITEPKATITPNPTVSSQNKNGVLPKK
jgi:polyisoprenyl-teichoic acid--peptidoglycan teichoic acid transferase